MKKNFLSIAAVALVGGALMTSCGSDDVEGCTNPAAINYNEDATKDDGSCGAVLAENEVLISSNITEDTEWTNDKVYVLGSRIAVESGATLTINAGTVIKGFAGSGANATALVIAQGAKLMAEGTATDPIIFTAFSDDLEPGEIVSPNLSPSLSGLWGGLIVLGKAPISADANAVQIEGIPASDNNGLYGGADSTDNSGVISYVSIRHGGANIGEGNEINGLTLGGVGAGTSISYVEIVGNQDDGVEFFGGTVNVSNLIVWNAGDDAVDTDQGWAGTLDNFVVVCGDQTDHALEIDGPEGALEAGHTLTNGTVYGSTAAELGNLRDGARVTLSNIGFTGFPDPATDGRGDFGLDSEQSTIDNLGNGAITLTNLEVVLPATVSSLTDVFKDGTDTGASAVTSLTVGATPSVFAGWTWAVAATAF